MGRIDGERNPRYPQIDMGSTFARDVLCAFVAQSRHVDSSEEMLPRTEQDRTHGKMQRVNQAGAQVLSNSGYAATERSNVGDDQRTIGARSSPIGRPCPSTC
jgi:hypothetical protein